MDRSQRSAQGIFDAVVCAVMGVLLLPVCAFWSLLLALWARAGFYVP